MVSTFSAPSAVNVTSKALRYGTQKTAGHASVLADMEWRKRGVACKVMPLVGPGADLPCLPAEAALVLDGGKIGAVLAASLRATGGRTETRGARAPPLQVA
jgi:hypothetical protein